MSGVIKELLPYSKLQPIVQLKLHLPIHSAVLMQYSSWIYKPVNVTQVGGNPIIDMYVIFAGTNIIVKC
jgi:hypothetical protein